MSQRDVEAILVRHLGKSLLLDSNLLLLFLIGTFQRDRIPVFKRTAHFTAEQFDTLLNVSTHFQKIVTTPHLLTEVSNLANSLPEYLKGDWSDHLAEQIPSMTEILDPAFEIIRESAFNPFGIGDAAVQKASAEALVLTEDYRLSGYLRSLGIPVLNFSDILDLS